MPFSAREQLGLCCIGIPSALAGCAVVLSVFSNFWCISVVFEGDNSPDLSFGIWNYKGAAIYYDYYGNLYAASKCNAFPDEANLDALWKTAQAFSILAFCLGCIGICIPFCGPPNKGFFKMVAGYMFFVTLCQGLTMVHMSSDGCKNNQAMAFINQEAGRQVYPGECKMDAGMKINITVVVLYFVAGVCCLLIKPEPEDKEDDGAGFNDVEKTPVEVVDAPDATDKHSGDGEAAEPQAAE